ncbi:MAG: ABC transporter permease [Bacteroidetes bacterium]|nr:ABC transporter permease [Bacteroidota bacterium]
MSSGSLGKLAWRRFRKNHIAYGSLVFICLTVLMTILGYVISPDHSPMVNEQNLVLSMKKPGFSVKVLKVRKNEMLEESNLVERMLFGEVAAYRDIPYSRIRFDSCSLTINEYTGDTVPGKELTFGFPEILYPIKDGTKPVLTGKNVNFITADGKHIIKKIAELRSDIEHNSISNKKFLLGSDRYGRDVLSQLMIGTRISLSVGFISVLISLFVGILLGALAGYFGGKVDAFIIWLINVIWAVPTLLLVIAITFALGKGFWQVFIAVGLTMWVEVARVVRGQFMSLREKDFVEASVALGYRHGRIIFRHILPNAMAPVIVISAANFASAILLEAGLSFLGIGVQPPMPSWGSMIRENYGYIILDYAYLAIFPGLAIMIMVLAFMLIGNGLRDAMDVKTVDG